MKIEELFTKALGWYKGLKTWKKVAGFAVLILIAILGVLYLALRLIGSSQPVVPEEVDDAHKAVVDKVITDNRKAQRHLEAELLIKKSEAHDLAQQRIRDAQQQRDVRDAISNAQSFEEVDALLKGLKR